MTAKKDANVTPGAAWRAMTWKEFRENARWGVLALLLLSAGMAFGLRQVRLKAGFSQFSGESLTSDAFVPVTVFGCAAAAMLLGIIQTFPERRPDAWALLIHRPVSPTRLFVAKATTGLALYLGAAMLPLVGAALWLSRPGHMPTPFDWRLALPGLADVLAAASYYFAGMLIGLRPARWYGSRLLVLGTAVVTSMAVVGLANEFWQALVYIAIGAAITATAAWASFVTRALTERQPGIARLALRFSIYLGLLIVGAIGISLVGLLSESNNQDYRYTSYYFLPDATVIVATTEGQRVVSITDTAGQPLEKYKDITRYEQLTQLTRHMPEVAISLNPNLVPWSSRAESYRSSNRYFANLRDTSSIDPNESWYYVYGDRQLVGFDIKSGVRIGAIGPDGFVAGEGDVANRFDARTVLSSSHWFGDDRCLLISSATVYDPMLERRRVDAIFHSPNGDVLRDAAMSSANSRDAVAGQEQRRFLAAATAKAIYIVPLGTAAGPDVAGAAIVVPPSHDVRQYDRLSIAAVADGGYAIRYLPAWDLATAELRLPDYQERISPDGKPAGELALPPIEYTGHVEERAPELVAGAVSPPAGLLVVALFEGFVKHTLPLQKLAGDPSVQRIIALCLIDAVLCAVIAFGLTRRYAFSRTGRFSWTIAVLLLGPAALLTLFATHSWPALERCPSCGRKRVVTHERCDHCEAGFQPPAADGTEILVA
jgi:hypothetical protein